MDRVVLRIPFQCRPALILLVTVTLASLLVAASAQAQQLAPPEESASPPRVYYYDPMRGTTALRETLEWSIAAGLYVVDGFVLDNMDPWPSKPLLPTKQKTWGPEEDRESAVPSKSFYIGGVTLWAAVALLPNDRGWLNHASYRHAKGFLETSLVATPLLTTLAKLSTGKKRPYYDQVEREGGPLDANDRMSFWSGHASTAFSQATYFNWFLLNNVATNEARHLLWKVPAILSTFGLASYVAYTRLDDHRHDVLDVTVGSAVGAGVSTLIYGMHENWFGEFYDDPADGDTAVAAPTTIVLPTGRGATLIHRF